MKIRGDAGLIAGRNSSKCLYDLCGRPLSGRKKEETNNLYEPGRTVSSTKLSRPRPYLCLYVCCDLALVSQLTVLLDRPLREALGCKCLPEALRSKFHARFFTATFVVRICVVRGVPVFDHLPSG